MAQYIALAHPAEGGGFGISFPDFPGCTSAGDTLEDAQREGAEALAFFVEDMQADGEPVPNPSSFDAIRSAIDPWWDLNDAIMLSIPLVPAASRFVRVNLTLDERLLRRMDTVTNNRSGFIAHVVAKALDGAKGRQLAAQHVRTRSSKA